MPAGCKPIIACEHIVCECAIAIAEIKHSPTAGYTESHRRSSGCNAGTADQGGSPWAFVSRGVTSATSAFG
jgi:hypothetical protein